MSRVEWSMDRANTGHLSMPYRLLLAAVALHVDTNGLGKPIPTTATLARQTGYTPDAVRRRMRIMRERGDLAAMLTATT
jgi:hypothetical protein